MDRPIAYDKLAREERFVRRRAREVAEIKVSQGLPPFPDLSSSESIKERVHGIMVGELQAMEGAGRSVCDFPDAPWEFTMDMARQTWDESRHVEIYLRLLEHLGGYAGEFPETTILWRCACAEDAAARVAGVNRGLEGLACDVFNQLVHIARKIGDPILERAVDFVLADEITHVRMGSKWLTKLTEGDAERRRRAIEFQESIDERFNLGGVRREGDHDAVSISNPAVAAFMDSLEDAEGPDQTVDRLVGVYGVLKPHLLATYRDHLARANPVYEPPTRRILARCIDDEERHIAAGETILKYLAAGPRVSERASARRRHLEGLLAVAGGVTGDGLPTRDAPEVARRQIDLSDDAREFIRLEKATGTWPVPEDLDEAQRSFAAALVAGDGAALARWLVPGLELEATAWSSLLGTCYSRHLTVRFARLGHQRLVKTRLEGPSSSATVLARWTSSPQGWRIAALDVAGRDAVRPA